MPMATTDRIIDTTPLDVRAQPLIDALIDEYSTRYHAYRPDSHASAREELARYPAEVFAPPEGAFVLLLRDGETIGGGAFKRYDAQTAGSNASGPARTCAARASPASSSRRSNCAPRSKAIAAST